MVATSSLRHLFYLLNIVRPMIGTEINTENHKADGASEWEDFTPLNKLLGHAKPKVPHSPSRCKYHPSKLEQEQFNVDRSAVIVLHQLAGEELSPYVPT